MDENDDYIDSASDISDDYPEIFDYEDLDEDLLRGEFDEQATYNGLIVNKSKFIEDGWSEEPFDIPKKDGIFAYLGAEKEGFAPSTFPIDYFMNFTMGVTNR